MALAVINVGSDANDGTGDPLRTACIKCNINFAEINSRVQTTPPLTSIGTLGDVDGMYAYDATYFYYCYQNYDGSSNIWNRILGSSF